jgi:diguanylate cyclase (GGDEF)-like protein/PAS domain S-box-containing protein
MSDTPTAHSRPLVSGARSAGVVLLLSLPLLFWLAAPANPLSNQAVFSWPWVIALPFSNLVEIYTSAVAALLFALFLIDQRRNILSNLRLGNLGFALALMLASELLFLFDLPVTVLANATVLASATDLTNVLGHVCKVAAFLFLYRTIFSDSVLTLARSELNEANRLRHELLETAPDAILVTDTNGVIRIVNQRLERLFGYNRAELLGQNMAILVPEQFRERHHQQHKSTEIENVERAMTGKQNLAGRHKDGCEIPLDIALSTFNSETGTQITAFIRDVSEQRNLETELRRQSTHDALTGLPNRTLFQDRLTQAMQQAKRQHSLVAVAQIDLDNFKAVNDGWGHNYGDQLLVEVARRLQESLRAGDTVARLGGDEFALVLSNLNQMAHVEQIVNKVLLSFSASFRVGEHELYSSLSIGVTVFPMDGEDVTTLLRNADVAMYRAKSEGRGCARFFTHDLSKVMQDTLMLQTYLKYAVEAKQLELHYQPQIDLRSGAISGVEALLRWTHAELGPVSPARFIPVAEASGLIVPIGEWVIETACRQIRAWQDAGTPTRVAVNLSPHQFRQRDPTESVRNALRLSGASPALLELELTESAVMEEPEVAARVLRDLESLGITIAIDDFGTGYSSLAYLKVFSLHKLKIDRSFIQNLSTDPDDAAIVHGLIGLAHSLGLQVIAEGVETEDQRAMLAKLKCDEFQGWLFSKALPAENCSRLLADQRESVMA